MMLCATIKEDSLSAIQAANRQADLIELRLDLFTPKNLASLRKSCQKPVIFKANKFDSNLLSFSPDYLDLPFGVEVDLPLPRICSYHDEEKTPDLWPLYQQMQSCRADYYKIATKANSGSDALRMLEFVKRSHAIGLCMGEKGAFTRILAPVFGAPWTYAPLCDSQRTAPGQLLLEELKQTYRYYSLSPKTQLYGLIGDPVDKSIGHIRHNASFDRLGVDAVYVKMCVAQEEVSTFLPLCQRIGFRGLSVTMPLKQLIKKGEAINTIGFSGEEMVCLNTDGKGALDALESKIKVANQRVLILGAGGSAIAIAKEAKSRGAELYIANRTFERAFELAQKFEAKSLPIERYVESDYAILINCTPTCPVPSETLLEKRVVMDIISVPKMTPLLQGAEKKGCTLVFGEEMFMRQAELQSQFWLK